MQQVSRLQRWVGVLALGGMLAACASEDPAEEATAVHKAENQSEEAVAAYADGEGSSIVPGSLAAYDVTGLHVVTPVPAAELEPGPEAPGELRNLLNVGYVLIGLRGSVADGALTRLQLKGIAIREDGSWDAVGATYGEFARQEGDDGESSFQASLESAKPFVVVGVGMQISEESLSALQLVKREYSPEERKLTGDELVETLPYEEEDIELSFATSDITTDPDVLDNLYIVGLGSTKSGNEAAKLRVWTASLQFE